MPTPDLQQIFDRAVVRVDQHHERDPQIVTSIERTPNSVAVHIHCSSAKTWIPQAARDGQARHASDGMHWTVHTRGTRTGFGSWPTTCPDGTRDGGVI